AKGKLRAEFILLFDYWVEGFRAEPQEFFFGRWLTNGANGLRNRAKKIVNPLMVVAAGSFLTKVGDHPFG
ncbi:MAG: hypothetical protein ACK5BL_07945, partial [Flavobacteriales bacterium]